MSFSKSASDMENGLAGLLAVEAAACRVSVRCAEGLQGIRAIVHDDAGRAQRLRDVGEKRGNGGRVGEIGAEVRGVGAGGLLGRRARCEGDAVPERGEDEGDVVADVGAGAEEEEDG
jgi:hypothetical protein